jgi:hypothetical protein
VPNTNECGVIDILTGSGSCVGRTSVALSFIAMLEAKNCDGTTPTPTAGTGAAGAAGIAGMGAAGAAGMAGTGAAGMAGMGAAGTGTAGTQ